MVELNWYVKIELVGKKPAQLHVFLKRNLYERVLCNEELNDLFSSPNIIRVIKLRRMK
jgi:hypothetical protein